MAFDIKTSITIQATPEKVWSIFSDFNSYPTWNPFIKLIKHEVKEQGKIEIHLQNMTFKPVVNTFVPLRALSWTGHLLFPGIFDGTHSFEFIDNQDGTTTLHHNEHFTGILIPLLRKKLDTESKAGFIAMNVALKERVEAN